MNDFKYYTVNLNIHDINKLYGMMRIYDKTYNRFN